MLVAMMDFITTMIKKRLLFTATVFFIGACEFTMADCDFTDFPTMSEMRISTLMGNAEYNNKPMMIRSFSANASPGSLVEFYRRAWKDAVSESVFGSWQQISTLERECFMTVQYGNVSDDDTFGRLVISNLPSGEQTQLLGDDVLKTSDSIVVSDLKTKDGPKDGRVTVLTSGSSVSELVNFYRTEMSAKGWGLERSFTQSGGSVLIFRRGVNESNISIIPAGDSSQILINQVDIN